MNIEDHIKLDIFLSTLMMGSTSAIVSPSVAVFIKEMKEYEKPLNKEHNLVGYLPHYMSNQKTSIYVDPYMEMHEKIVILNKKVIDLSLIEEYKNIELI